MRVIYYSRPCFLVCAFSQVRALSQYCDLHFMIEGSHNPAWNTVIESGYVPAKGGLVDARTALNEAIPAHIWRDYFLRLASFKFIGYTKSTIRDPLTWLENLRVSDEIGRFLRSISPDVIHIEDLSLRTIFVIRKIRRVLPYLKIVLTIHDPIQHSGEYNFLTEISRRIVFHHVDKFVLHSRSYLNEFLRRYRVSKEEVALIPLGSFDIFSDWEKTRVEEEKNTVLFFGRLSRYKGLETLFRAMPIVAKAVPNARFIIAGKPMPGYAIPDIPKLNGKGSVEIRPRYIPNDELIRLIQRAAITAAPYVDATQSGVILTAYAFNKPVVATNVGGLAESIKHEKTGLIIPPRDHRALADALIRILNDENLRQAMKNEIQALRSNALSWEKLASQTIKVYEKL